MNSNISQKLERSFNKMIASNQIHEAVIFVENTGGEFSFSKKKLKPHFEPRT